MKTLQKFKTRSAALLTAGSAMVLSGAAMASGGSSFDTSTITAKITEYSGYAIVILLAFAAAVWGLRAVGLIGGRK